MENNTATDNPAPQQVENGNDSEAESVGEPTQVSANNNYLQYSRNKTRIWF